MKIWKLQKNKIYFGEKLVFDINYDIISIFKLEEGQDLPLGLYEEVLYESCLFKAYKLLGRQDYSRYLLQQKLNFIYKNKKIVERVLDNLVDKAYINDYDYAKTFIENKNYGKKRIEYELNLRGIDSSIIKEIYGNITRDEKEEIRKLIKKVEKKEFKKQVEFLLRRGYNLNDILDVLQNRR